MRVKVVGSEVTDLDGLWAKKIRVGGKKELLKLTKQDKPTVNNDRI